MTIVDRKTGLPVRLRTELLPSAARADGWKVVGSIEIHFAWLALLAAMVDQQEFQRRGFLSPLPTYRELMYWNDEIFIIERVNAAKVSIGICPGEGEEG